MSLAFFRSFQASVKKPTVNEEKSDLSLLWESHCSPMKKDINSLASNCKTPKAKKSEINFLNLLAASRPQTPTKKLFCPPRNNLQSRSPLPKRQNSENSASSSLNDILYTRISITTDRPFSLPDEIKQWVSYVYAPTLKRGYAEFQNESWNNFKNEASKTAKSSVVSCATFAFLFVNDSVNQTKAYVKSFTGTAHQQIMKVINPNSTYEDEQILMQDTDFLTIDYNKAIDFIESINLKEKINIFSSETFHYSIVTPLNFTFSEFESSERKLFRVLLNGYMFPFQAEQLFSEKESFDLFKTSKSVLF